MGALGVTRRADQSGPAAPFPKRGNNGTRSLRGQRLFDNGFNCSQSPQKKKILKGGQAASTLEHSDRSFGADT